MDVPASLSACLPACRCACVWPCEPIGEMDVWERERAGDPSPDLAML